MLPQREFTNVSINLVMRIVPLIARGGPSSGGKRRRHKPLLFGCAVSLHLGPSMRCQAVELNISKAEKWGYSIYLWGIILY